jgi:phosphate transport system permease protein
MTARDAARGDYRLPLHRRRKLVNLIALSLSLAAMAFGLIWLVWILWDTLTLGVKGLTWQTITESTPPPNVEEGGLANAIVGSLLMVLSATAIASSASADGSAR